MEASFPSLETVGTRPKANGFGLVTTTAGFSGTPTVRVRILLSKDVARKALAPDFPPLLLTEGLEGGREAAEDDEDAETDAEGTPLEVQVP